MARPPRQLGRNSQKFINAALDYAHGCAVTGFTAGYGAWSNTRRRFTRWRGKGMWEKLLEILVDDLDYEWLMIDASHCKVHPHATGARGGNQGMSRTQGSSTPRYIGPWAHGMPVRIFITQGTTADYLLTDRSHDNNAIIEQAGKQDMKP